MARRMFRARSSLLTALSVAARRVRQLGQARGGSSPPSDDHVVHRHGPAGRNHHDRRRAGARLLRLDRRVLRLRSGARGWRRSRRSRGRSATVVEERHARRGAGRRCSPAGRRSTPTPVETITYNINPKAVWSDGVPITCADFQYTADQQQNEQGHLRPDRLRRHRQGQRARPEDRRRHVQDGQDLRRAGSRCSRAAVGILPSHLLKGKDRDKAMKDGYTWSGGPWFAKWNKGDDDLAHAEPEVLGPEAAPRQGRVPVRDRHRRPSSRRSSRVRSQAIYPQPQIDVVDAITAGPPRRAHAVQRRRPRRSRRCGSTTRSSRSTRRPCARPSATSIDRDAIVNKLFGTLGVTKAVNSLNPFVITDYSDQNAWAGYHLDLAQGELADDRRRLDEGHRRHLGQGRQAGRRSRSCTTAGNKRRELTEEIMQPELKAAGFDMTIKNTSADNLFGSTLPGRQLPGRDLRPASLTGAHAGPVLDLLHEEHPDAGERQHRQQLTSACSIPAADTLLAHRRQQPRRQRAPAAGGQEGRRHPRRRQRRAAARPASRHPDLEQQGGRSDHRQPHRGHVLEHRSVGRQAVASTMARASMMSSHRRCGGSRAEVSRPPVLARFRCSSSRRSSRSGWSGGSSTRSRSSATLRELGSG